MLLLLCSVASATVLQVGASGDYPSLQDAVDAADISGDTILLLTDYSPDSVPVYIDYFTELVIRGAATHTPAPAMDLGQSGKVTLVDLDIQGSASGNYSLALR